MLTIISPAKSLDFKSGHLTQTFSIPESMDYAQKLINEAQHFTPADLSRLMKISTDLAQLNFNRFANWTSDHTLNNAKQAVHAYNGDVYVGLDAHSFTSEDLDFAQNNLRIISGLYGALKPLDLIKPYRLEMGVKMQIDEIKNLYEFWIDRITSNLNISLKEQSSNLLINLASNEYFRAINKKKLEAKVITPVFKDFKHDGYKVIAFFAKKARGLLASYIIRNKINGKNVEKLQGINLEGYEFNPSMSNEKEWVFTRDSKG